MRLGELKDSDIVEPAGIGADDEEIGKDGNVGESMCLDADSHGPVFVSGSLKSHDTPHGAVEFLNVKNGACPKCGNPARFYVTAAGTYLRCPWENCETNAGYVPSLAAFMDAIARQEKGAK